MAPLFISVPASLLVRVGASVALIVLACLACVGPAGAQERPPQGPGGQSLRAPITMDSVTPGTFRGTLVAKDTAVSPLEAPPRIVTGTATWRFEMDSLDWRRKLTIRLTLAGPEHAVYVIRTAGSGAPRAVLAVRNTADSHGDPRHYMATLSVREMGEARLYNYWESGVDHVDFRTPVSLAQDALVQGALRIHGWYNYGGASSTRLLVGSFSARFDPRPEPGARAMSPELQTKVLKSALWDFASTWMQHKLHLMPADSVFDAGLARTYIRNRFGESVTVDSLSTDYNTFFVRLRGRFVPIECTVAGDSQPTCTDRRPWRSRLFPAKRTTE